MDIGQPKAGLGFVYCLLISNIESISVFGEFNKPTNSVYRKRLKALITKFELDYDLLSSRNSSK